MMMSWVALTLEVLWTRKLMFSHPPSPIPELRTSHVYRTLYCVCVASQPPVSLPAGTHERTLGCTNVGLIEAGTAGHDFATQYSIL